MSSKSKSSFLNRLKISQKIWILVIIAAVLLAVLAIISTILGNQTKAAIQEETRLSQYQVPVTQLQMEMMRNRMNISDTGSVPEEYGSAVAESIPATDQAVANLYQKIVSLGGNEDLPAINGFDAAYKDWTQFRDKEVIPLVLAQKRAEYFKIATAKGAGSNQERITTYTDMVDEAQQQMLDKMNTQRHLVERNQFILLVTIISAGIIGILLMTVLGAYTIRLITKPVKNIQNSLKAMSSGDLTQEPTVFSQDEMGDMANSIIATQTGLRRLISDTMETVNQVDNTVEAMLTPTQGAAKAAVKSQEISQKVSAQANGISSNIHTVAAGAEEMSASIREISSNANEAASVASQAAEAAKETNRVVSKLGESSQEIGEVIKSITSIAEQTNLLALNATIEAARAGDAGKGFAVVAGEVKDLAGETASATENIGKKIEQIQGDTKAAIEAIEHISEIIDSINGYQATIAAAVEEQTATTNEMSRSVADAAEGSSSMASSIGEIADMTTGASDAMSQISESTQALNHESTLLKQKIGAFKY